MNRLAKLSGLILFVNSFFTYCSRNICTNRFENQHDILVALPELKNCSVVRQRFPICGKQISVLYTPQPPYVLSSESGKKPTGLLPDLLNLSLDICCFGCSNVTFHGPVDYLQKFKPSDNTLFMPLQSAFGSNVFAGHDYIPFLKTPGVTLLAKEMSVQGKGYQNTQHLMHSVLSTWPLFLLAILMAISSGCVVWCLDTWFNIEHFPQNLPSGAIEGFWWAFVAMTTVGFGDRVPKSYIARLFSVVWIFVGITVFSMYTAVLTSALAIQPIIFEHETFVNKSVGVLSFTSAGEVIALEEHANYKVFHNIEDMAEALQNDIIHAIILDNNIARYYKHDIRKIVPSLRSHHAVESPGNSYGVLSHDSDITVFIRSFFETNEDQRHAMVLRVLYDRWPEAKHEHDEIIENTFIDAASPIYKASVIGLIIIGVVSIGVGTMCKVSFRRSDAMLVKYVSCMEGNWAQDQRAKIAPTNETVQNDSRTIQACRSELEQFSTRWKANLRLLDAKGGLSQGEKDEYPVRVVEN